MKSTKFTTFMDRYNKNGKTDLIDEDEETNKIDETDKNDEVG